MITDVPTPLVGVMQLHSTTTGNATLRTLAGELRPQFVLEGGVRYIPSIIKEFVTGDTRVVPILGAGISALVLICQVIVRRASKTTSIKAEPANVSAEANEWQLKIQRQQRLYALSRFLGCLALWCAALLSAIRSPDAIHLGLAGLYTYILLLVLTSLKSERSTFAMHSTALLLLLFAIYLARDVFPLATFTLTPHDLAEGWVLWVKIALLGYTAAGVPLLVPRTYVPLDMENPSSPAPDQTASLLSLLTYGFLDRTIFEGYARSRIGNRAKQGQEHGQEQGPNQPVSRAHLAFDALPPLADYDRVQGLVERTDLSLARSSHAAFKSRHLFFSLVRAFPTEVCALAALLVLRAGTTFIAPVGVNRLLTYLESPDQASFRPWLWILVLFAGPLVSSMLLQRYIYVSVRTISQIEAILTQRIFEHALRIRVKAEIVENSSPASGAATPVSKSGAALGAASTTGDVSAENEPSSSIAEDASATSSSAPSSSTSTASPPTHAAQNLSGKISSLITTDMNNIRDSIDFLVPILFVPLHIALAIWFLYFVLGWSAFVGLAVIVILLPVPGYIIKLMQDVEVMRMQKTDARVQGATETLNVLRMVKLFGWEAKVGQDLNTKREEELRLIKKRQILDLWQGITNFMTPLAAMVATYATYLPLTLPPCSSTLVMKQPLNASKVFSSMSIFDILRGQFFLAFKTISQLVEGKVSIDRVSEFLCNTELLDSFTEVETPALTVGQSSEVIGFRDASFTWSAKPRDILSPGDDFLLTINEELNFKRGRINLIVGPTGSGKTSLLMALLGEMHFIPSGPQSYFNLPRGSGVAYVAQESWVLNETIKNNIIFNSPFDEMRYKKVLHQCCLERDLTLFKAGDQTEVGEKGLTLSGGQKARVTLARAIYSRAEVLLLDDVFAALDVHTAKWIIDNCFAGDLMKERTVVLVTHNIALVRPIADYVVTVRSGTVFSHGSISEDTKLAASRELEKLVDEKADHSSEQGEEPKSVPQENKTSDGTLIVEEEVEIGRVKWKALNLFLSALAGRSPISFYFVFISGLVLADMLFAGQTWYLGHWASQYDSPGGPSVPALHYLGVFGLIILFAHLFYIIEYIVYLFGSIRASRQIHKLLMESILGTTLRWLDVTPTSRITARCTQDIGAVDGPLASRVRGLADISSKMLAKLVAIVIITPLFLGPSIAVTVLGVWLCSVYMASQLWVKREMSNAKAPVLGHFGAAMNGIVSIRAYGVQDAFITESHVRINRYTRSVRTFYNLNRWVTVRVDLLGTLFTTSLATFLVYFRSKSSSDIGFSLNMSVIFSSMSLFWVMFLNELEVQANSLERILGYLGIEQEPKSTKAGVPPAYWPASGDLRVENLSARYSENGPEVLHGISFHVTSGERVGIVGRTGSGKSTLTLSLLRFIFTTGNVYYDGISTNDVNLDILRSSITIIPQIPELLSGTLRQNLDPFGQFDDAVLNDALQAAGLFSLQKGDDNRKITLDTAISGAGSNLSVGQRQILALARAIVRGSKLLILDEATSAIDHATDTIIQSSLRHQLGRDVTLLTVAHRLHTIMDADKIMVLDAGQIVEFAPPQILLQNQNSIFRALVDESGDKEALYAVARASRSHQ